MAFLAVFNALMAGWNGYYVFTGTGSVLNAIAMVVSIVVTVLCIVAAVALGGD